MNETIERLKVLKFDSMNSFKNWEALDTAIKALELLNQFDTDINVVTKSFKALELLPELINEFARLYKFCEFDDDNNSTYELIQKAKELLK